MLASPYSEQRGIWYRGQHQGRCKCCNLLIGICQSAALQMQGTTVKRAGSASLCFMVRCSVSWLISSACACSRSCAAGLLQAQLAIGRFAMVAELGGQASWHAQVAPDKCITGWQQSFFIHAGHKQFLCRRQVWGLVRHADVTAGKLVDMKATMSCLCSPL